MNGHMPHPGARVQVLWTDGRIYPATVTSLAQGLVQVRWDIGGAPAWVPPHVLSPLGPPVGYPQYPQQATPAPDWQSQQRYVPPGQPQAQQPPPKVEEARRAQPHAKAPIAKELPPIPQGAPPRPLRTMIRDLPRGLVYEPTGRGPGDGQVFFVIFGFVATADVDTAMRMTDIEHLGDDVAALRAAGFRVIVELHGDLEALNTALSGAHPEAQGLRVAGVFWSGHGHEDGSIATYEGDWIDPEEITPEAARRGTIRLFVMSACYAGSHQNRWQKALGPSAQVIGWGAPITNDRAIEFLVPDDSNSKGFDDLLEKHLGVRRIAADGALAEVKDLALKHEDKVATLSLSLEQLVADATKRLKCKVDKSKVTDAYGFEIRTPASKDYPNQPRSQLVRVETMGTGDAWVYIWSVVGPYSDALDLPRALRTLTPAVHIRLSLSKLMPADAEFVILETMMRRKRLDPHTFAKNILGVGIAADKLEDMFFGSDKR
jgi:hypothetical protein